MLCTEQVTEQEELLGYGRLGSRSFLVHRHQRRNQGCIWILTYTFECIILLNNNYWPYIYHLIHNNLIGKGLSGLHCRTSPCREREPCPPTAAPVPHRVGSCPPVTCPATSQLKTSSSTNCINVKIHHAGSLSFSQRWHILLHQTKQHTLLFPCTTCAARFNATRVKHKSFSRYESKVSGDSGRETYAAASVLPVFWLLFLDKRALKKSFINSKNEKMWLRNGFMI